MPGVQLFCGQLFQHRLTFFDDPTGYAHAYRRKVIPKRKSQHAGNRPLRISKYSQENTCVGVFFNKFAGKFNKKRLQHGCFSSSIMKFLRTAFFTEHLRRQLLYLRHYSTRKHSQKKRKEIATLSFLITIWNLQLKQLTFDEDHNIHTYSLFCSVVSAVENSRKPNIETRSFYILVTNFKAKKKTRQIQHTFL